MSNSESGGESRKSQVMSRISNSEVFNRVVKWLRGVWHVLSSTIQFFITRDVMNATAALTYSTLFATVPILAVVFAIARGFGLSKYIEDAFTNAMSSQPQVAEVLTGFVNSYLVHAQSSVIIGVGVVVMLVTVINLARKIEDTFNMIWQVKKQRDIVRSIINYIALFFLIPIILIISSGISIFMANFFKPLTETYIIGDAVKMGLNFVPYVFMMCVFTALYVLMPNTRVHLRYAIGPGILAGFCMQWLQYVYIHAQTYLSSYNAIYGSFAALPLFMLWVQLSWYICIFGAILVFAHQNSESLSFSLQARRISHQDSLMLSAQIMSLVCRRYSTPGPHTAYTTLELKKEMHLPFRVLKILLQDLLDAKLLDVVSDDSADTREGNCYKPAESPENLTLGVMCDRLDSLGSWRKEENKKWSFLESFQPDAVPEINSECDEFKKNKEFLIANSNTLLRDLENTK